VEFDPSNLVIDPQMMESFKAMMDERSNDPEYKEMLKQMINDPSL
jgi:hypothetical protein